MKFDSILRKIDRPPAAHNFSRLNEPGDVQKTASRIVSFALGIPAFNYEVASKACRDKVQFNLELETARRSVRNSGAPAGRGSNESFVESFFAFDEERGFSRAQFAPSYEGRYLVSREVHVPTKPSFTIYENGNLIPVILCGWKSIALSVDQIRLWMTLLESGLFSYSDYRNSPAEIVMFPEKRFGKAASREPHVIRRGDFELFTEREMREIAAEFVSAQELAVPIAREHWEERELRRSAEDKISPKTHRDESGEQSDFFKR